MSAIAPAAIESLWEDINRAVPAAVMSGIVGDVNHSYGYHLARRDLPADDYSVQLPQDRRGSDANASALDISFPPDLMTVVTRRLFHAARADDPRLAALREFCGTLNGKDTFPWDLSSGHSEGLNSWDDSHLWHVHLSFYREHADDYDMLAPIAEIIAGVRRHGGGTHAHGHKGGGRGTVHQHGGQHGTVVHHGAHNGGGGHAFTPADVVEELLAPDNLSRIATALMRHPIDGDGTTFIHLVRQARADAEAAAAALNDPKRGVVVQLASVKQAFAAQHAVTHGANHTAEHGTAHDGHGAGTAKHEPAAGTHQPSPTKYQSDSQDTHRPEHDVLPPIPDHALTDADIAAVVEQVVDEVTRRLRGALR